MSLVHLVRPFVVFIAVCVALLNVALSAAAAHGDDYIIPESGDEFFRNGYNIAWFHFVPGDDDLLLVGGGGYLRLWNLRERRLVAERLFQSRPELMTCDEAGLMIFDGDFLEFDPHTLKQRTPTDRTFRPAKPDDASPAMLWLEKMYEAHGRIYLNVRGLWRSSDGSMACRYADKFYFVSAPGKEMTDEEKAAAKKAAAEKAAARKAGGDPFAESPFADALSAVPTTDVIELGRFGVAYSPAAKLVAYSDQLLRNAGIEPDCHVVCERYTPAGKRTLVNRFRYPPRSYLQNYVLSPDGTRLACVWSSPLPGQVAPKDETHEIEVFRVDDGVSLGRIDYEKQRPIRLQFSADSRRFFASAPGRTTIHDVEPTGLKPRIRLPDGFAGDAGLLFPSDSLDVLVLQKLGHGFSVVDPMRPEATRFANAADHTPIGLWGDDAVVLKSEFGITAASLVPGGAEVPKLELPPTTRAAVSGDRRCLIYASAEGKVSVRLRDRTLLTDFAHTTKPIETLAVSGDGEYWATSHEWDIRIMRRAADGTYARAREFDAGAEVRELTFSPDGGALLAMLKTAKGGGRAVVYRRDRVWQAACGPFDYQEIVRTAAFVDGGRQVAALGSRQVMGVQREFLEVRRTTDDVVVSEASCAASSPAWRQLGDATRLPLLRDGRLIYRDIRTQQETPTESTFATSEIIRLVDEELKLAIFSLRDGRLAVREVKRP